MNIEMLVTIGVVVLIAGIAAIPRLILLAVRLISREVGRGFNEGQQNKKD